LRKWLHLFPIKASPPDLIVGPDWPGEELAFSVVLIQDMAWINPEKPREIPLTL
jgi:hypothetical protein